MSLNHRNQVELNTNSSEYKWLHCTAVWTRCCIFRSPFYKKRTFLIPAIHEHGSKLPLNTQHMSSRPTAVLSERGFAGSPCVPLGVKQELAMLSCVVWWVAAIIKVVKHFNHLIVFLTGSRLVCSEHLISSLLVYEQYLFLRDRAPVRVRAHNCYYGWLEPRALSCDTFYLFNKLLYKSTEKHMKY